MKRNDRAGKKNEKQTSSIGHKDERGTRKEEEGNNMCISRGG
jgi:hypothetical protein